MGANVTKDERLVHNDMDNLTVCYKKNLTNSSGLWRVENSLTYSLPVFVLQLTFIIMIISIIKAVLKPLRQPPIVGEIFVSILLSIIVN
jgi:hypothetical protein